MYLITYIITQSLFQESFLWPQERRIAQQREMLKKERETAEKIAARAYTQQYLADLLPAVFTSLRGHGYFYDPVEKGQPSPAAVSSSISFLLSDTWGCCCTPLHTAEEWLVWDESLIWFRYECFIMFAVLISRCRDQFLPVADEWGSQKFGEEIHSKRAVGQ